MWLDYICEIEVRFKDFFFSVESRPAGQLCYALGIGAVTGDGLRGTLQWTNRARRRDDGTRQVFGRVAQSTSTWLPHFDGVILTDDGAQVLFSFSGYNRSVEMKDGWHHRAITARTTFSSSHDRYRHLNKVFGVLAGRGAWPMDEGNFLRIVETGHYKDGEEEVWRLPTFACINDLAQGPTRALTPVTAVSSGAGEGVVRLKELFAGNLHFAEAKNFPTTGEDGDWVGFVMGGGKVAGELLSGDMNWANISRRRADGVWLADIRGEIQTGDGAIILFAFSGYDCSLGDAVDDKRRALTGSITFRSGDARYRWLNDVFGLLEGEALAGQGKRWQVRAFACLNEFSRKEGLSV